MEETKEHENDAVEASRLNELLDSAVEKAGHTPGYHLARIHPHKNNYAVKINGYYVAETDTEAEAIRFLSSYFLKLSLARGI